MPTVSIETLIVSSPAFKHEGEIPQKYTCEGEEINPPLQINEIPHGTQALALIMEDPDAPGGTFVHWVVWNIPPDDHQIHENSNPGISGMNSGGKTGYHGPCPPSGSHRYYFHVYALDREITLAPGESKHALIQEMEKHTLAKGSLMGTYQKTGAKQ
ncbi:MAG: YbhB/YbcL family Raf kinase inhibitor-like protein [Citrobacter freundii]|nr:MAG: YbhB/YbcL family Raf kinase inhibitor-like protein [Citrobacter freundii]